MSNIITFVNETKNSSFDNKPVTEVDCLIFCQLSYLIYDKYVSRSSLSVPFSTFNSLQAIQDLTADTLTPSKNVRLLQSIFSSHRYSNMQIESYCSLLDTAKEQQFAAMVFRLPNFAYIAFRGTDVTILGWKEDFHMSYTDMVPAQEESVSYLNRIVASLPAHLAIYVGGHSKGGNLATYASICCDPSIQRRLNIVRNYDGPGFRTDIFAQDSSANIAARIKKFVPHDTIIGVVLLHNPDFKVVKCENFGIWQHDPFNWIIRGDDFVYKKKRSKASRAIEKSFYIVLEEMNDEERRNTITAIFNLFEECKISKVTEFKKSPLTKIGSIISRFHKYDRAEQQQLRRMARLVMRMYLKSYFSIST